MQLMDCGTAPGHQVYKLYIKQSNLTYAHNIQLYSDIYDISPILFVFYKYGLIFKDLGYILYAIHYQMLRINQKHICEENKGITSLTAPSESQVWSTYIIDP